MNSEGKRLGLIAELLRIFLMMIEKIFPIQIDSREPMVNKSLQIYDHDFRLFIFDELSVIDRAEPCD